MVYVTRGLLDALLGFAGDAEPEPVAASLDVTRAAAFEGLDLPPDAPVFTHFYLPEAGRSVSAVFGVDLSTPPGRTPGRFVSHPDGELDVRRSDDLREVVLVAIPPWDDASVAAFSRAGTRRELVILDAEPPAESI